MTDKDTRPDIPLGSTYDAQGNWLTNKDSTGFWWERTYDAQGNELTYKDSTGYRGEGPYGTQGNKLAYKGSDEEDYHDDEVPDPYYTSVR